MNPLERELADLSRGVSELAASLEADVALARDRESHVRTSTRAARAATLAESAQRVLRDLETHTPAQSGLLTP